MRMDSQYKEPSRVKLKDSTEERILSEREANRYYNSERELRNMTQEKELNRYDSDKLRKLKIASNEYSHGQRSADFLQHEISRLNKQLASAVSRAESAEAAAINLKIEYERLRRRRDAKPRFSRVDKLLRDRCDQIQCRIGPAYSRLIDELDKRISRLASIECDQVIAGLDDYLNSIMSKYRTTESTSPEIKECERRIVNDRPATENYSDIQDS